MGAFSGLNAHCLNEGFANAHCLNEGFANAHCLNEVFPNVIVDEDDHSAASAASQPSASGHSCRMAAETA